MNHDEQHLNEILDLMSVPGWRNVYVLGCFARYITVYSQQVRALNLAYALYTTGKIKEGTRVAVVGGGIGGLTIAVAAGRLGASVTLLEKLQEPLGLQRNCTKRYIHPHIYDWPAQDSRGNTAQLPVLDWTAGSANIVAEQIESAWREELRRFPDRLRAEWDVQDADIGEPRADRPLTVTWNSSQSGPRAGEFDIVFLAVGFGLESDVDGSQHRYWEDDRLDRLSDERRTCLVSGCGDGGLTDVMRLCIKSFRHDRIVNMFIDDPRSREIGARLLEAEEQQREHPNPRQLSKVYEELDAVHVQESLRKLRRTDTVVYLTGRSWWDVYGSGSSVLNRFIVSQLAKLPAWSWIAGPMHLPLSRTGQNKYEVRVGKDGKRIRTYDVVATRHGSQPALASGFPSVWEACGTLAERWRSVPHHADPTRKRLGWGEAFAVPISSPFRLSRRSGHDYRLVAFDADGTILQAPGFVWSWSLVWEHLGYENSVRAELMNEYVHQRRGKQPNWYSEWCEVSARYFRDRKLVRHDFAEITSTVEPVSGLRETIQMLKDNGIKTAIISGGVDTFLDEKIPDYHELFDHVFINRFKFDAQGLLSAVDATEYDFEGKWEGVKKICALEGFDPSQVAFVGDGFNDAHVLGKVGLTISFNPSAADMAQNADVNVPGKNLREILPHVLRSAPIEQPRLEVA